MLVLQQRHFGIRPRGRERTPPHSQNVSYRMNQQCRRPPLTVTKNDLLPVADLPLTCIRLLSCFIIRAASIICQELSVSHSPNGTPFTKQAPVFRFLIDPPLKRRPKSSHNGCHRKSISLHLRRPSAAQAHHPPSVVDAKVLSAVSREGSIPFKEVSRGRIAGSNLKIRSDPAALLEATSFVSWGVRRLSGGQSLADWELHQAQSTFAHTGLPLV